MDGELEPRRGHRASSACHRETTQSCEGQRFHNVTNRMRLTCTSGSVGAPGSNPWSDPAQRDASLIAWAKSQPPGNVTLVSIIFFFFACFSLRFHHCRLFYLPLTAVGVRPQHSLSKAVRDLFRFTPAGKGGMTLRLIRTVRNTFVLRGDPPHFRCASLCGRLSREGRIASCRDCRGSSC